MRWGKRDKKGHKKTFGNYGYLDGGDDFFHVCVSSVCENVLSCTH